VVPSSWRHAAVHVGPHIRKVSVIRRTRRYRSSARSRGWSSGDSSPSGAKLIYHFTRTGPQRCDLQRRPRISGVGRAVEIRTCGQETQARLLINSHLRKYVQDHLEGSSAMLRRGRSPGPGKRRSSAATSLIVVTARGSMVGSPSRFPTA